MSATDIAALLAKQSSLNEGVARLAKLKKESEYHRKQAERKAAEAVTLESTNATLKAELDALTGGSTPPPAKDAKDEGKKDEGKKK